MTKLSDNLNIVVKVKKTDPEISLYHLLQRCEISDSETQKPKMSANSISELQRSLVELVVLMWLMQGASGRGEEGVYILQIQFHMNKLVCLECKHCIKYF